MNCLCDADIVCSMCQERDASPRFKIYNALMILRTNEALGLQDLELIDEAVENLERVKDADETDIVYKSTSIHWR